MTDWNDGPPACKKVPHIDRYGGYLHGEDDDSPYDVDGVAYCGRCHRAMSEHGTLPGPAQPERRESVALQENVQFLIEAVRADERAKLEQAHKARLREEAKAAWDGGAWHCNWLFGRGREAPSLEDYLRSRGLEADDV